MLISKVKKIILGSFFKVIFKILEVHGKKINKLLNKKPNKDDDEIIEWEWKNHLQSESSFKNLIAVLLMVLKIY